MDIIFYAYVVTAVTSCVTSVPETRDSYFDNFGYFHQELPAYGEDGRSPVSIAKRQATSDLSRNMDMDYSVIPLVPEPPNSYEYTKSFPEKTPQQKEVDGSKFGAPTHQVHHSGASYGSPPAHGTIRIVQSPTKFQWHPSKYRDDSPLSAEQLPTNNQKDEKEILQTAQTRHYYYYPYFRVRHVSRRRPSRPRHPLSNYEDSYDRFPTVA